MRLRSAAAGAATVEWPRPPAVRVPDPPPCVPRSKCRATKRLRELSRVIACSSVGRARYNRQGCPFDAGNLQTCRHENIATKNTKARQTPTTIRSEEPPRRHRHEKHESERRS